MDMRNDVLERLIADAERYRWLRSIWDSDVSFVQLMDETPQTLDAAIDAAMRQAL